MKKENEQVSLFIYPTFSCNERCNFCFFQNKESQLDSSVSLAKIKENLKFLEKRHNIRECCLLGGEPTIYKDFYPLMNVLAKKYIFHKKMPFLMATNAVRCAQPEFSDFLSKFFLPQFNKSKLCVSVSTLFEKTPIAKLKKRGILNLAKKKLNILFVLVFTKQNLAKIKQISDFLIKLFYQYYFELPGLNFIFEMRLPFLMLATPYSVIGQPKPIIKSINTTYQAFSKTGIPIILRNIPFCYIKNFKDSTKILKPNNDRKFIAIYKSNNINNAKPKIFLPQFKKIRKCQNCLYFDKCSGIEPLYFKKFHYLLLRPFLK